MTQVLTKHSRRSRTRPASIAAGRRRTSADRLHVLVFEPKYIGHYPGFASWTANAFRKAGHTVTLAVPMESRNTTEVEHRIHGIIDPAVEVRFCVDLPLSHERWVNARPEANALATAIDQFRPDHVVVPSGDFILNGLLVSPSARRAVRRVGGCDLIVHNFFQAYPRQGEKDTFWRMLDKLAVDFAPGMQIHTVDPFATSSDAKRLSYFRKRVLPLPHPHARSDNTTSKLEARAKLGLDPTKRIVAAIGDIGARKGTNLFIDSFTAANTSPETCILLAGRVTRQTRIALNNAARLVRDGRITIRNEFLSDEEFSLSYRAADAYWAGYPRHIGIASSLLFAADRQTPAIGSDFGCVGWMIEEYGLGKTFAPTRAAMVEALEWFDTSRELKVDSDGRERLLSYHTLERFGDAITAAVR